ncbi:MAG: GTPase ObgE, partial [Pseudomonadota bacterium]
DLESNEDGRLLSEEQHAELQSQLEEDVVRASIHSAAAEDDLDDDDFDDDEHDVQVEYRE